MAAKQFCKFGFVGFLLVFFCGVAPTLAQTETDSWPVDGWDAYEPRDATITVQIFGDSLYVAIEDSVTFFSQLVQGALKE
jgi:hypothetical protein